MDWNEAYSAPASEPSDVEDPIEPESGLLASIRRGAMTGFRWVSFVALPIAVISMTLGLAITAFTAGTGRGWGLQRFILAAFMAWPVCALALRGRPGRGDRAHRRNHATRPARISPGFLLVHPQPADSTSVRSAKRERGLRCEETGISPRYWPWLVGIPILLTLVSAYATGLYVARVIDRRLTAANAAADRDDPYWRIDDLMEHREQVPDDENSALVVAEVVSMLPDNWPGGPSTNPGQPPRASALEDAYSRFAGLPDNVVADDAIISRVRSDLATHGEAIQLARTLVNFRRGRHELELGPLLMDTRLEETQASRTVARLLNADAALRAYDGDLMAPWILAAPSSGSPGPSAMSRSRSGNWFASRRTPSRCRPRDEPWGRGSPQRQRSRGFRISFSTNWKSRACSTD